MHPSPVQCRQQQSALISTVHPSSVQCRQQQSALIHQYSAGSNRINACCGAEGKALRARIERIIKIPEPAVAPTAASEAVTAPAQAAPAQAAVSVIPTCFSSHSDLVEQTVDLSAREGDIFVSAYESCEQAEASGQAEIYAALSQEECTAMFKLFDTDQNGLLDQLEVSAE